VSDFDAIIIGGGHNGLVSAAYLARAGYSVCVLESADVVGGAAISADVFPGVPARLSKYSYLVSLLPQKIQDDLGITVPTVRRSISSFTPDPADPTRGLAIPVGDDQALRAHMREFGISDADIDGWIDFYDGIATFAKPLFDTLTEPMPSRDQVRAMVGDESRWQDFFERPLGEVLERTFTNDVLRGVVFTDALIGTFAEAHDPSLRQNICFLYHVIGRGTGDWDVPIGGMGAVTGALAQCAREAGAQLRTGSTVSSIEPGVEFRTVRVGDEILRSRWVLANCAPSVLDELLGRESIPPAPMEAGAQVKVNMVLKRLPRLRDRRIDPRDAFMGTFHINEGYAQLQHAFDAACSGSLPRPLPAEIYCHSLTDPSILGSDLQDAGAQTLTMFALHAPHDLFCSHNEQARIEAQRAAIESLNSVLDEPIEDCLWIDANGDPCIEVNTTVDIERQLGIPTGNIFHTPLDWPYAQTEAEIGTWGVETDVANVLLCGSGARRGGGVSGIPGHNAAQFILGSDS
jgi:phytoene dehydrogenase-like protein